MSKNTAPQTATVTTSTDGSKKDKKKLFGLSADDLKMVVGGGGVIVNRDTPKP